MKKNGNSFSRTFNQFSSAITRATGRPAIFIIAFAIIIVWGFTGPLFHYSDTWQLVINTGTSIITFLMVFVIQQSQNKDTMALQLKLNELIAANKNTSNRLINIEGLTDDELEALKKFYVKLGDLAQKDNNLFTTHSIDEAKMNHAEKATQPKLPVKKSTKP